ncbi:MAG: polysaccharide biosynthesis/export family protein [candidate division KSB1 bacterium]|nr:polysaccharide biosynthesis/export family protein [candidate division KSB1 bacterium]
MAKKHCVGKPVVAALFLVGLWGVLSAGRCNPPETSSSTRTVGPGDAVRLRVWDAAQTSSREDVLTAFSGDYTVDGNGDILIPRLGTFRVAGQPMLAVEKAIEARLSEISKRPVVMARPLIRVLIWGAVKEPGSYLAEPSSALWEVLQLSGGPEMQANLEGMYVQRGNRKVIDGLREAFRAGQTLAQIGVQSGDVLVVPYRRRLDLRTALEYTSYVSTLVLLYLRLVERW